MKALIFAVAVSVLILSGCAFAPHGANNGQNQQSAVQFASEQAMEMKVHGNKFMQDALSDEGACNGSMTSTPTTINKDAALSNRNGGVSFYIISNGSRRITCGQ